MKKFRIVVDIEYVDDVDPADVEQRYVNAMMKEVGQDSRITDYRIHRRNGKRPKGPGKDQLGLF